MINVVEISKKVLERLCKMDFERFGGSSDERLIFPNTFPSEKEGKIYSVEELKKYTRISEQELRFLFVDEFIKTYSKDYFYSVETPTEKKYRFGDKYENITCGEGRSASIDMSIFNKNEDNMYLRILNIEFKHQNSSRHSVGKDVLKLINECQNGAFIILLKNTDSGSLCSSNNKEMGVLDKLSESFNDFKGYWKADKNILLVLMSLKEKTLIYRNVNCKKIVDLDNVFSINSNGYGNITKVCEESGWKIEPIK